MGVTVLDNRTDFADMVTKVNKVKVKVVASVNCFLKPHRVTSGFCLPGSNSQAGRTQIITWTRMYLYRNCFMQDKKYSMSSQ